MDRFVLPLHCDFCTVSIRNETLAPVVALVSLGVVAQEQVDSFKVSQEWRTIASKPTEVHVRRDAENLHLGRTRPDLLNHRWREFRVTNVPANQHADTDVATFIHRVLLVISGLNRPFVSQDLQIVNSLVSAM